MQGVFEAWQLQRWLTDQAGRVCLCLPSLHNASASMQEGKWPRPGALRPSRRPLAPRNVPQIMSLLDTALGCPASERPEQPQPIAQAVETLGAQTAALFARMPEVLADNVLPVAKVCISTHRHAVPGTVHVARLQAAQCTCRH